MWWENSGLSTTGVRADLLLLADARRLHTIDLASFHAWFAACRS